MGRHRRRCDRAADSRGADPGTGGDDRAEPAATGAAGVAVDDGYSRYAKSARRHEPQLPAVQLDAAHRVGAKLERRLRHPHDRRAERHERQCGAFTATLEHAVARRAAADPGGAPLGGHAAGDVARGAGEFQRKIRGHSKPDRRHFDRRGSEGDTRSAGADRRRARYVAKRADQASSSRSGDSGATILERSAIARTGHRRPRRVRNPFPTYSLIVAAPDMGFFATFWSWLNGQLATYIGDNTARLSGVLEPAVVTVATIYVMAWGYLHLVGRIDEPFVAGLKRLIMLAVILAVGLRLWLYNSLLVDTFYNAPAQLAP